MQKRIFNLPRTVSALVQGTVLSALVVAAADVPGPAPAPTPPPAGNPAPPAQQPAQPGQGRQGRGQGGGGNNTGPGGGGNFQGGRGGGNFGGGAGIALDDKQRELLREATQSDSDEMRKLNDRLQTAQKELVHAVVAEKYDEKIVREKAEAVSKIQTEITMLRAKTFATVSPTLRPDQREQIENSRIGIGMIMGGGGGIGGVGFAGGPGGGGGFRNPGDGPPATDRTARRNPAADNGGNVDPNQQQRRRGGQGQGQ